MELYELTIHEIQDRLLAKETTSAEVTASVFKRIDAVEKEVRAYITLMRETALAEADAADEKIKRGERRTAHRNPHRPEGYLLHQRGADHLRLPHSQQFCPSL